MFDDSRREEFLSEEDLDLANLPFAELVAYWNLWLEQAQATNDSDADEYSHGVFVSSAKAERLLREHDGRTQNEKYA